MNPPCCPIPLTYREADVLAFIANDVQLYNGGRLVALDLHRTEGTTFLGDVVINRLAFELVPGKSA